MNHSVSQQVNVIVNGASLLGKTKDAKFPIPERVTETVNEGRVIESFRNKGFKVGEFSFRQDGLTHQQVMLYGLAAGQNLPITMKESVENADGTTTKYEHQITGVINKVDKDKMAALDENIWTISGQTNTYKLLVDGKLVHDINVQTQKVVLFGKDLTKAHIDAVR
jgi:phage tail tube protein FII